MLVLFLTLATMEPIDMEHFIEKDAIKLSKEMNKQGGRKGC
jgi:hypothetical protein